MALLMIKSQIRINVSNPLSVFTLQLRIWLFRPIASLQRYSLWHLGCYNCPKQFLSIPLGATTTQWKFFHAALFRPCQPDIVQCIICSSCSAGNGLQAVFGLAVITSGNHYKAYIKLAWSIAIRCPNGFLWSWHGAVCFQSSRFQCSPARRG